MQISSRGWVVIAVACLIIMVGGLQVLRGGNERQGGGKDPSSGIPLNTLDTRPPLDPVRPPLDSVVIDGSSTTHQIPLPTDRDRAADAEPPKPVVWVTEEGAKAYAQPGFNMPELRTLSRWEELQVVESTRENWDRVKDLEGQEFWVQKKIVTVIRPQNLSQPSVAEKKVMDFYTSVAHGEHSDAYVHLSPEWKRELSYERFVDGYDRTDSLRSEIVNVFELGTDRYQVDVAMEAVEEGEPVDYLGIYTVEKVETTWYLTSGSLKRQVRRY